MGIFRNIGRCEKKTGRKNRCIRYIFSSTVSANFNLFFIDGKTVLGELIMAEYITWKPSFSVGDTSIDAQHQQIIAIINEVHEAWEAHKPDADLLGIMDRLMKYTVAHFHHEERVMRDCDYPALESHILLHQILRRRTLDLRNNITLLTARDVLVFLKDWWCTHILEEDNAYSPYLGVLTH
jgi:hemerythrin